MKQAGFWLGLLLIFANAGAADFSGNIAAEAITFSEPGKYPGQMDDNLTFSFKPKWEGDWNQGDDLWSAELFMRLDHKDEGRQHVDIRELLWLHVAGDNEWRVGVNTMFWGVTESRHLVDVINQIDQVEGIDGEEKLGQPMIHLNHYEDWGVLDFLILPGFRERTFQSMAGRLRPPLVVDTDQVSYESSEGRQHTDFAVRFSQTYDDLDLGLSLFDGTNRDPILLPGVDAAGNPVLTPHYELMTQFGLDAQLFYNDWIWRLEYIHRNSSSYDLNAVTGGFEYTFFGVLESEANFGALVEYSYEDRSDGLRSPFDRDLFLGGRYAFNDVQSSEILAGVVVDTELLSRSYRVEASRRVGDSWRATLEMQVFSNIDQKDVLAVFESDDFLLVEMAYFF